MNEKIQVAFFDAKPYDIESFNRANQGEEIEIIYHEERLTPKTARIAEGAQAVCAFVNDDLQEETLKVLIDCGVKLVALRCAGYNNVDFRYALGRIHVVRVPAYSPYAVAEHAMSLLMTLNRKLHKAYNRTREFNFSLVGLTGMDLHGKVAGVIGTGKIGRCFINICKGLGMRVLAYDPFPVSNPDGFEYADLETIFRDADILSLHCPLTKENVHMIDADAISKMKDGVILINTSRGALVDSQALLDGLLSRKIGAAGLDVYEEEAEMFYEDHSGSIVDDPILSRLIILPNVLVTSHQAFLTNEALANIADTTLTNIHAYFSDASLVNEVCYQCTEKGTGNCEHAKSGRCFA